MPWVLLAVALVARRPAEHTVVTALMFCGLWQEYTLHTWAWASSFCSAARIQGRPLCVRPWAQEGVLGPVTASHSRHGTRLCTAVTPQHVCSSWLLFNPDRLFKLSVVSAMERHRGISEDRVGCRNAHLRSSDYVLVGLGSQVQVYAMHSI